MLEDMKRTLITTFLFITTLVTVLAMPRLTVVIVADGLTTDNLETVRKYLSQGGLRTLCEEATMPTMTYPHLIYGGVESVATLVTGHTPSDHGIIYDSYFRPDDKKIHPILEDRTYEVGLSPRGIGGTTLTDEIRMTYGLESKIYAVGLDATTTILLAGHGADGGCWLTSKGIWETTPYYPQGLPMSADSINKSGTMNNTLNEHWVAMMSMPMYSHVTKKEIINGFNYPVKDVLLRSPQGNNAVLSLAAEIQKCEKLGIDNIPDILLLHLNLLSPATQSDAITSAEQEDLYLRLNRDLGVFMDDLNKEVGTAQYRIVLIGKPTLGRSQEMLRLCNVDPRIFNLDKAIALTSVYLTALYGNKKWIAGGYLNSIYLNRKLIDQENLSLPVIQEQVANFLRDFEGVKATYTINNIACTPLATSICYKKCGDVCFVLQDNWQLYATEDKVLDGVLDENPTSPILFYGAGMKPQSTQTLLATDIKKLLLK